MKLVAASTLIPCLQLAYRVTAAGHAHNNASRPTLWNVQPAQPYCRIVHANSASRYLITMIIAIVYYYC